MTLLLGPQPWQIAACLQAKSLQSCLTLQLHGLSLPGPSVPGILQARISKWVAMPSSRGSSQPRDRTSVSHGSCIAGGFFTPEPPGKPWQMAASQLIKTKEYGPHMPMPGAWSNLFIGLTKKFVQVFPLHLTEKPKGTFWPTQYFLKPKLAVCYLPCLVHSKDQTLGARVALGAVLTRPQLLAALSWGDRGDTVRRIPLNWAEPTHELS